MKLKKEIISERKFKAGYIVKTEKLDDYNGMIMKSAYNLNGVYIGDAKTAFRLCQTKGIKPEGIKKDSGVCSIGFCEKDNKWYGWSHRAIYGFGIGKKITNKASGFTRIKKPFIIKSLVEAKRVAIKFANSVS